MNKKKLYFIFFIFSFTFVHAQEVLYNYDFIYENKVNEVAVSNKEANNIICKDKIETILSENGHGLKTDINGNKAKIEYSGDRDLLITVRTKGKTYEVLLKPFDIQSKTIFTKSADPARNQKNGYTYLYHDKLNEVAISNKEINRITCNDTIKKIILPRNSEIVKEIDGSNAYLQYWGKKNVVIHIKTTHKVYSVNLKPSDIPAKTMILESARETSLVSLYGNKREKIAVGIIKAVLTDGEELKGATIKKIDKKFKKVDGIEFLEHRRYQFDSDKIVLMEFWLKSKKEKVKINEEYILKLNLFKTDVIGLTLDNEFVYPDRVTRLFVVGGI